MLAELIRSALEDEALASGLSTRLNDMKARLERLETRAGRKRQLALRVMGEADIQKLMQPDFTASLKQGAPTLDVVDEAKVPAAYWKPQPSKLDRQGLLSALKAGVAIDGVAIAPAPDTVECEDTVMALTEIQTKSLKPSSNAGTSRSAPVERRFGIVRRRLACDCRGQPDLWL